MTRLQRERTGETSASGITHDRFFTLVEAHKGILYKVANGYCRDPDDRPDLIQEILLQLWLARERFDGRSQFSTWAYRIGLNVAISFYRSGQRRIHNTVSIDEPGFELGVADKLLNESSDELRLLHQAITRLEELDRALIILYLDGYPYETIGEIVGLTPTNVATRLNRAKRKLQRHFEAA